MMTSKKSFFYRNIPRKHFRKQPYPMKSPVSSGDGFVYRINLYEIYAKNPNLLLNNNSKIDKLIKDINQIPIDHQNLNFMNPQIIWDRTKPKDISQEDCYNLLHEKEKTLCSKLRLTPFIYLKAKYNILKSAQNFKEDGKSFKKVNAQACGINFNVNKACVLWDFFNQLKWV